MPKPEKQRTEERRSSTAASRAQRKRTRSVAKEAARKARAGAEKSKKTRSEKKAGRAGGAASRVSRAEETKALDDTEAGKEKKTADETKGAAYERKAADETGGAGEKKAVDETGATEAANILTMAAQNHDQIFNQWVGKQVTIKGVGGTITRIPGEDGDSVRTRRRNVWSDTKFHTFVIERAPESQGEGLVAFRAKGTDLYLTISLYGDKARRGISSTLSRTPLHPDLVPVVVDFAVGRGDDNFEGKGFSYSPMTVEPGPPSLLQAFRLEQNFLALFTELASRHGLGHTCDRNTGIPPYPSPPTYLGMKHGTLRRHLPKGD
eukprot:CAMPEP_0183292040 /NCGR_PEP_ID=MMETSP0160_2-20130417/1256_1 /TAXON_ID=2839 ORGANISM="Odontella Sinensis, Strain Grunow 1884" /NCGR_SAMPLE_ID=MMETSP0160_2 /ASSEMBLY_ACC=CAM_ASM_000250 /LENGTH=320 /DNA_ID=CAMNT_0025452947 /DNA_START=75 /DNA_END=1038 /DNA_ORIENTATION=+